MIIIIISSFVVMVGFVDGKDPVERAWNHIILEFIHKNNTAVSFIHIKNFQYIIFKHKALMILLSKFLRLKWRTNLNLD